MVVMSHPPRATANCRVGEEAAGQGPPRTAEVAGGNADMEVKGEGSVIYSTVTDSHHIQEVVEYTPDEMEQEEVNCAKGN